MEKREPGRVIPINRGRQTIAPQCPPPQPPAASAHAGRPVVNQYTEPRVLKAFYHLRQSVERIAARERVGRLAVQSIIRECSVPVEVIALRKAA